MSGCAERSGFLFAHACDRPSTGACFSCGKAICVLHTRLSSQGGDPLCVTCAAQERPLDEDDPYHDRGYYDADDVSAFDDSDDSSTAGDYEADPGGS